MSYQRSWRPGPYAGRRASAYDADAQAYISAVEAADGQALEAAVKDVINAFVVGCKADGIWAALKACCILAGARTLNGCLVPLVGPAPTNFNFVSGDYDRKTGLVGNGTTKYLDSNRAANADPLNSSHLSVYKTNTGNSGAYIGNLTPYHDYIDYASGFRFSSRNTLLASVLPLSTTGLLGFSRSSSSGFSYRILSSTTSGAAPTVFTGSANYFVFNRNGGSYPSSARLSFYSIGESLDLAILDARIAGLMNALASAIP
jgi:hypothetical protein